MKLIPLILLLLGASTAIADRLKYPTGTSKITDKQIFFVFTSSFAKYLGTRTQAQEFFGCEGYISLCARAYTIGPAHTPVPALSIYQSDGYRILKPKTQALKR